MIMRLDLLLLAERFMAAVDRNDLYEALGVDPRAGEEEIDRRVRKMRALMTDLPRDSTPREHARMQIAVRVLNRVGRLLRDPEERLEHDLRHGLIYADERIRAASESEAELDRLLRAWRRVYKDESARAEALAREAEEAVRAGLRDRARTTLARALELDPFDHKKRALLRSVS
jgi:uncharacterized Ntn-hydrolase superfamily protein